VRSVRRNRTSGRRTAFPGGIVRALARTAQAYYGSLAKAGTNTPFADRMFVQFAEIEHPVGERRVGAGLGERAVIGLGGAGERPDRMFDFGELNALIGTPEMLARGRAYEGAERAPAGASAMIGLKAER
jgi:hypothetical protein